MYVLDVRGAREAGIIGCERTMSANRGNGALLIGSAGGFPVCARSRKPLKVFVTVCVRAPVPTRRLVVAFLAASLGCHVSSSIVLSLRYNARPAAAACTALTASSSSSSSITPSSLLPPPPPRSCALLCYFKRSSASWVLQCLSRACLVTYGGDGSPQRLQYPECPGGHIKVSDYNTLEGMKWEEEDGGRICRDQYGV